MLRLPAYTRPCRRHSNTTRNYSTLPSSVLIRLRRRQRRSGLSLDTPLQRTPTLLLWHAKFRLSTDHICSALTLAQLPSKCDSMTPYIMTHSGTDSEIGFGPHRMHQRALRITTWSQRSTTSSPKRILWRISDTTDDTSSDTASPHTAGSASVESRSSTSHSSLPCSLIPGGS